MHPQINIKGTFGELFNIKQKKIVFTLGMAEVLFNIYNKKPPTPLANFACFHPQIII